MEEWQVEYEWLRVRHVVKKSMGKTELPNMNNIFIFDRYSRIRSIR